MKGASKPAVPPFRVGLLGMYSSANLGDTAIQTAVMRALHDRRPEVEFVAICTDPGDAARTFGLRAHDVSALEAVVDGATGRSEPGVRPSRFARSRLPLQLLATAWHTRRIMRDLDMLLVSGSGQIDDFWGGPWEQPFRLLAWSAAARSQGKPVAYFGVGVDQLHTRAGRRLCLAALGRAQLRVLRDAGSLAALQTLGFDDACGVSPDPAFHLRPAAPVASPAPHGFAVVSPIARHAWPGASDDAYASYLRILGSAADHLQRRGLEVHFVCSQTRMDPPVVPAVQATMRGDVAATRVLTPQGVDDYLRLVQGASVVVASRLHALILALVAGTPVVGVSYARKVTQQMTDAGLAACCLELATLSESALLERIDRVLAQPEAMREHIAATTARFHADLAGQFDRLAALMQPVAP